VREQRSLAYQVRASIFELAHGPEPIVTYAGTQTSKTAAAVQGLVDNIQRLQKEAPSSEETAAAGRFLSDIFAIRLETVGAIADLLVQGETLGLPDGYWDTYRGAVRSAAPKVVGEVAARVLTPEKALIVVAGDAELVAPTLTKFGDVTVVDPENDFKTIHTLPAEAAPPSPP
jgi:predicted Zn-dependent peptidase